MNREQLTDLERQALNVAALITSYSPDSAWANQSPSHYALFLHSAYFVMFEAGITPDENIRCWFWQIDELLTGDDNSEKIAQERLKPSPKFEGGLFRNPDGTPMSNQQFITRYRT